MEEPKKTICQEESGSPAQIWADLDCLATEILGSDKSRFSEEFELLNNTAVSSELAPELPGFDCPTAGRVTYSNTTHRTPHTAQ